MTPRQLRNIDRATRLARLIVQSYRDTAPGQCDPVAIEGWAAAAVAVSAIGVGVSAYDSSASSSAQQAQAAALAKKPPIVPATFEDPSTAYGEYNSLVQNQLPGLNNTAATINTANNRAYQSQLSSTSPNLLAGISAQGTEASQLVQGQIPADVAAQVQRSSAYQALSGGYGTSSGAGHALTARDLGTTSLALMQQGSSMLGQNLSNTAAVNPSNLTGSSLMLTPQQLLSRDDSNNAYSNAVLNQNNNIQYQNGIYAAAANSYNPTLSGVSTAAGGLGGLSNSLRAFGSAYGNSGGSSGVSGSEATALASQGGVYNPYLDTNNYSADGTFIGNANSYG